MSYFKISLAKFGFLLLFSFSVITSAFANSSQATQAQRIISLSPHLTEWTFALGAGDRLVGVSAYSDYPEAAKQLPVVANYQQVNLESLIALKPDLVLIWDQGPQKDLAKQLASFGIASYSSDINSIDDLAPQLRQLGTVIGAEQQGLELADNIEQKLNDLRLNYQQRPALTSFYQLSSKPLQSISNKSWLNHYLEICGLENILANAPAAYPVAELEGILQQDPALIIISYQEQHAPWLAWPQLQAVKKQQFILIDPDSLHRLVPRTVVALTQLCEAAEQFRE